eukprot:7829200-Alexandrium_andersonii.AAC.1
MSAEVAECVAWAIMPPQPGLHLLRGGHPCPEELAQCSGPEPWLAPPSQERQGVAGESEVPTGAR